VAETPSFAGLSREFLNLLKEGVFVADARGRVLWANDAGGRLLRGDRQGRGNPEELPFPELPPEVPWTRLLRLEDLRGEPVFSDAVPSDLPAAGSPLRELLLRRQDGAKIPVRFSLFPLAEGETLPESARGLPAGDSSPGESRSPAVLLVLEEMSGSERPGAPGETRLSLEAAGKLTGRIAHDLTNRLNGIAGFAEILSLRWGGDPDLLRYGERILEGCHQALDLVSRIRFFSRKAPATDSRTRSGELTDSAARMFREILPAGTELVYRPEPEPPVIKGDWARLLEALLSLGLNAREALAGGGRLILESRRIRMESREEKGSFPEAGPGEFLRIRVEDSGPGIPEENRDRVFEPFFSTRPPGKGLGLGLSLAEAAVREASGWITLDSGSGTGARFDLFLPVVPPEI